MLSALFLMKKYLQPEPVVLMQACMPWFFVPILKANHRISQIQIIVFRLNRFLPKDISVSGIYKVVPDAHARFSAVSRTYKYYISKVKDPFLEDSSWFINGQIDVNILNRACGILMKYSDFTSFSKLHSDVRTNLCTVYSATLGRE